MCTHAWVCVYMHMHTHSTLAPPLACVHVYPPPPFGSSPSPISRCSPACMEFSRRWPPLAGSQMRGRGPGKLTDTFCTVSPAASVVRSRNSLYPVTVGGIGNSSNGKRMTCQPSKSMAGPGDVLGVLREARRPQGTEGSEICLSHRSALALSPSWSHSCARRGRPGCSPASGRHSRTQ